MTIAGCQTVKQKTDAIVEKENKKLSEFIGKSASKLQMELGKPDEILRTPKEILSLYTTQKNTLYLAREDLKLIQKIL